MILATNGGYMAEPSRNQVVVFDLTTTAGFKKAVTVAKHPDLFERLYQPIVDFAKLVLDKGVDFFSSSTDTTATIREQRETAIEVIKAGKEAGASSIELTLDAEAAANIGASIGKMADVKVLSAGKAGKMKIKIQYK